MVGFTNVNLTTADQRQHAHQAQEYFRQREDVAAVARNPDFDECVVGLVAIHTLPRNASESFISSSITRPDNS